MALWMRLRDIAWAEYETSAGSAERMPKLLQDLASRKRARAMKAGHELWRLLCKGGLHSAAAPTLPFLIEIADIAVEDVLLEIGNTLQSCAAAVVDDAADSPEWYADIQQALDDGVPTLQRLAANGSVDVQIVIGRVLDTLQS